MASTQRGLRSTPTPLPLSPSPSRLSLCPAISISPPLLRLRHLAPAPRPCTVEVTLAVTPTSPPPTTTTATGVNVVFDQRGRGGGAGVDGDQNVLLLVRGGLPHLLADLAANLATQVEIVKRRGREEAVEKRLPAVGLFMGRLSRQSGPGMCMAWHWHGTIGERKPLSWLAWPLQSTDVLVVLCEAKSYYRRVHRA